ncbi:trypsin-like serine peptidase [Endozoicomonas sp. ALD040]|uniref:trypsin-like serine peptidase n=1 Tax=Endozoicomonas sp. ALD040 TaxID=3403079 RepID=UPI003BAF0995
MKKIIVLFSFILIFTSEEILCESNSRIPRYTEPVRKINSGTLPWIAGINDGCTTVLISDKHLLTSAHCIGKKLDITFLNAKNKIKRKVIKYIINNNFFSASDWPKYDIAILELNRPVSIPPADIDYTKCPDLYNITHLMVAGYGNQQLLQLASVSWVGSCNDEVHFVSYPGDSQPGDSGSPLFYRQNNSFILGIHVGKFYQDNLAIQFKLSLTFNRNFIEKYVRLEKSHDIYYLIKGISLNAQRWNSISASASASASASTMLCILITPLTLAMNLL